MASFLLPTSAPVSPPAQSFMSPGAGNALARILQGLGAAATSYGSGSPQWGMAGAQAINDSQQQEEQRRRQAIQDQFQQEQIQRQRDADARDQAQRDAAQKAFGSLMIGDNPPAGLYDGQGRPGASVATPSMLDSLPALQAAAIKAKGTYDPSGAVDDYWSVATAKPAAPITNGGMQYDAKTDTWSQIPGWLDEKKAEAAATRAPLQPSEMKQRALDAGLVPGTGPYRNFMLNGGAPKQQGITTLYDPSGKGQSFRDDDAQVNVLMSQGWTAVAPPKPETKTDLEKRAADAGLVPDTPEYKQFMATGGKVPEGPGGTYGGTAMDAQDSNIILKGQTDDAYRATPEYAMAYNRLYEQPKYQLLPDPNNQNNQILTKIPPIVPKDMKPPIYSSESPVVPAPDLATPVAPAAAASPAAPSAVGTSAPRSPAPTGYQYDEAGHLAPTPGGPADPNTPTPEQRNTINQKLTVLTKAKSALDQYRATIKKVAPDFLGSVMGLPTQAASEIGTAYTSLAIQAKELFDLGALSGPDYGLIQQTIRDPNTAAGWWQTPDAREKQLDQVQVLLDNSEKALQQNYSPAMRGGAAVPSKDDLKKKYGLQ